MNNNRTKTNKNSFFALNIRQRILLSFFVLLMISFSISALNILGLQDFYKRFSSFKTVSEDTFLMLKIDHSISELQRAILVFSHTEKISSVATINELHGLLLADIKQLVNENSFTDIASKELLKQMQSGVENFHEKIDSLQTQKSYREELVNTKRTRLYESINSNMLGLFALTEKFANQTQASQLINTQRHIANAEVLGGRRQDIGGRIGRCRCLRRGRGSVGEQGDGDKGIQAHHGETPGVHGW